MHLTVAIVYALLASYYIDRVRLPGRSWKAGWRVLATIGLAALFFIGSAYVHANMAYMAYHGILPARMTAVPAIIACTFQILGGAGFYLFGKYWVQLNIFDKRNYEKTIRAAVADIQSKREYEIWKKARGRTDDPEEY